MNKNEEKTIQLVLNGRCNGEFDLSEVACQDLIAMGVRCFDSKNEAVRITRSENINIPYIYKSEDGLQSNFEELPYRSDERLLKVVLKLRERADGKRGKLKIIDAPDNKEWFVHRIYGVEMIIYN